MSGLAQISGVWYLGTRSRLKFMTAEARCTHLELIPNVGILT